MGENSIRHQSHHTQPAEVYTLSGTVGDGREEHQTSVTPHSACRGLHGTYRFENAVFLFHDGEALSTFCLLPACVGISCYLLINDFFSQNGSHMKLTNPH